MFKSPVARILMGIASLFALVIGAMQMTNGLKQIFWGGEVAASQRLLIESDQSMEDANKLLEPSHARFAKLLSDFDAMELADFRRDKKELGDEVEQAYANIEARHRHGIEKINQAAKLRKEPKIHAYLVAKSKVYAMYSESYQKNREIVRLAFDESLTDKVDITAKINASAKQRDKIQSQAETEEATAEERVKKS
jgi:hypothetical protein